MNLRKEDNKWGEVVGRISTFKILKYSENIKTIGYKLLFDFKIDTNSIV